MGIALPAKLQNKVKYMKTEQDYNLQEKVKIKLALWLTKYTS